MMGRKILWAAFGAFAVGTVLGALLVFDGDLTVPTPAGKPSAPRALPGAAIRVENVGTHAINATMEVTTVAGETVWRGDLVVPNEEDRQQALPSLRGEHFAKGRFTWAQPPRRGTGDQIVRFDAGECEGGGLVVVFVVESTNGIAISSRKDCPGG